MLVLGLLLLPTGFLSLGLGLHLRRSAARTRGKGKKRGKEARPAADPTSFIVGGALFSLGGVACLVASAFA